MTYFKQLHGNTNRCILPIILEKEPDDVLPPELKYVWQITRDEAGNEQGAYVEVEPLCADIRAKTLKEKKRLLKKKEHMRIAAPIMGLRFDDLYQRQRRITRRKYFAVGTPLIASFLCFTFYNQYMLKQLSGKQAEIISNESKRVAALALQEDDQKLSITMAQEAVNLLPEDAQFHSEAENTLRGFIYGEQITSQRDVFHLKATLSSNVSLWVDDVYADGNKIAVTDWTNTLLYDTNNGELLFSCEGMDVFFNEDASRCVSVLETNQYQQITFQMFDTETGEELTSATYDRNKEEEGMVLYDCTSNSFFIGYSSYSNELGLEYHFYKEFTCNGNQWEITDENALVEFAESQDNLIKNYAPEWKIWIYDFTDDYLPEQEIIASNLSYYYGDDIMGVVRLNESYDCYTTYKKYYVVNSQNREIVLISDSPVSYEKKGNRLIICNDYNIKLYNINSESTLDTMIPTSLDSIARSLLSEDGSRYINLISKDTEYVLSFGLLNQDITFEAAIYACPERNNYPFYADATMNRIAYVTPSGEAVVKDFSSQQTLFEKKLRVPVESQVFAVSLNKNGKLLAVSYDSLLQVYRIEDGKQIAQIDCAGRWEMSGIDCLEFSDRWLLVADGSSSVLLPVDKIDSFTNNDVLQFENGNEGYGMPRFLTGDDLLFCTDTFTTDFQLANIYDLVTEKSVLPCSYRSYAYDEASKTLIVSPYSENDAIPVIDILQRDETGGFEKIGSFQSDTVRMVLNSPGSVFDNGLLILNNHDCTTEIYKVDTQTRLYTIDASNLYIKDGFIYDSYAFGTGLQYKYDLTLTGAELQTLADQTITSIYGKRSMTQQERKKYAMDGILYQDDNK